MAKTFSFAIVHFTVAFAVGYLMTGSVLIGGTLALVEPACNTIAFHFHENLWKRIGSLRVQSRAARLRNDRGLSGNHHPFIGAL